MTCCDKVSTLVLMTRVPRDQEPGPGCQDKAMSDHLWSKSIVCCALPSPKPHQNTNFQDPTPKENHQLMLVHISVKKI